MACAVFCSIPKTSLRVQEFLRAILSAAHHGRRLRRTSPVIEVASPAEDTLLALASRLAESAGRGGARALTRLDGGKNNRVYRIETDAGDAVLKHYFSDPRDPRDRLAAEWGFLKHTWSRGVRAVPEPLASDATARAGLYGFVPGRKLLATELKPQHIDAAIDFVLAVNAAPRAPLAPASEACFSLA